MEWLKKNIVLCLIILLVLLTGLAIWQTSRVADDERRHTVSVEPEGVMGTRCKLTLSCKTKKQVEQSEAAFKAAMQEIRRIEGLMSSWIKISEVSQFNEAKAGEFVLLSPEILKVLWIAKQGYEETDGAFDITCRPSIELWKKAKKLPSPEAINAARAASNWDLIELSENGATKKRDTVCIDLGGIAKGYAIDRACQLLQEKGYTYGYVEIGGDLCTFSESGKKVIVDIHNPSAKKPLGSFRVANAAVCTSGDSARYVELDGKRYSHIIDPRTGKPAEKIHQVTVRNSGKFATTYADLWATALVVTGVPKNEKLPAGMAVESVVK